MLQSGVKSLLKEQLIRREEEISKPEQWLQFAREEECIQKRIHQQRQQILVESSKVPFFRFDVTDSDDSSETFDDQELWKIFKAATGAKITDEPSIT